MGDKRDDVLDGLEAEAIHILREVTAGRERPVTLFSGGKDSSYASTPRPARPSRRRNRSSA
jgi:3'-phosphoadenosine 5'-phosphosulfate sulfotransferase (PAPS reductase)/FAD synthetase